MPAANFSFERRISIGDVLHVIAWATMAVMLYTRFHADFEHHIAQPHHVQAGKDIKELTRAIDKLLVVVEHNVDEQVGIKNELKEVRGRTRALEMKMSANNNGAAEP